MVRNRLMLGLLVVQCAASTVLAEPVVDPFLTMPPRNRLTMEDLWNARLTTTGGPVEVFLRGYLIHQGDTVLSGYSSNTLTLATGTRTIRSADIKGVRDVRYKEGYKQLTLRGGEAPEGKYTACLEVYDNKTKRRLGVNCVQVDVVILGAPRLISPADGAMLPHGRRPLFTWTRATGPRSVTYGIDVVEMLPGQTKEEAVNANPPYFSKTGLAMTNLHYPVSARRLHDNTSYAWWVRAYVNNGTKEIGRSEILSFSFAAESIPVMPGYRYNDSCCIDVAVYNYSFGGQFYRVRVRAIGNTIIKHVECDGWIVSPSYPVSAVVSPPGGAPIPHMSADPKLISVWIASSTTADQTIEAQWIGRAANGKDDSVLCSSVLQTPCLRYALLPEEMLSDSPAARIKVRPESTSARFEAIESTVAAYNTEMWSRHVSPGVRVAVAAQDSLARLMRRASAKEGGATPQSAMRRLSGRPSVTETSRDSMTAHLCDSVLAIPDDDTDEDIECEALFEVVRTGCHTLRCANKSTYTTVTSPSFEWQVSWVELPGGDHNDNLLQSTEENPEFTFDKEGQYTISLKLTLPDPEPGEEPEEDAWSEDVVLMLPKADFTWQQDMDSRVIHLTNTSKSDGPATPKWRVSVSDMTKEYRTPPAENTVTFGGDTPVVPIDRPGVYHVKLTVSDGWCTDSKSVDITIEALPRADFGWRYCALSSDVNASFRNYSTGFFTPLSCQWDFGDGGVSSSSDPTVEHKYTNNPAGKVFPVTLTVTDAQGQTDSMTKQVNIANCDTSISITKCTYGRVTVRSTNPGVRDMYVHFEDCGGNPDIWEALNALRTPQQGKSAVFKEPIDCRVRVVLDGPDSCLCEKMVRITLTEVSCCAVNDKDKYQEWFPYNGRTCKAKYELTQRINPFCRFVKAEVKLLKGTKENDIRVRRLRADKIYARVFGDVYFPDGDNFYNDVQLYQTKCMCANGQYFEPEIKRTSKRKAVVKYAPGSFFSTRIRSVGAQFYVSIVNPNDEDDSYEGNLWWHELSALPEDKAWKPLWVGKDCDLKE